MANEEPYRSLQWPAVLVGIGVAGSLDEIVLHQQFTDELPKTISGKIRRVELREWELHRGG